MGACQSLSEEEKIAAAAAKQMDKKIEQDQEFDAALIKLLLLGAGESGKSTIFKQMRILYGEGFGDDQRKQTAPVIISNLIGGTRTILENCENTKNPLEAEDAKAAADLLNKIEDDTVMDEATAKAIQCLWADEKFQATFADRANFQLFDCYADFAKSISKYPEWAGPNWTPSVSDVMKARVRTSGIVEENYTIDGVNFVMYDVGGQRNERKKWIHCFENVTAIIFVGAISEYDQVLFEDNTQNRLVEAVELFENICNSKWFLETSIILFLNKKDLFEEKFLKKRIPLNTTGLPLFEDWTPIDWASTDEAVALSTAHEWIINKFMIQNHSDSKEVYHHITCATDTQNVETVFNACKDIILKGNLKSSGFMD